MKAGITIHDVSRYWKAQLRAIDRWEWLTEHDYPQADIDRAWEEIEDWTQRAIKINTEYNEQYERRNCQHKNVIHQFEPDGDITICEDCGGWLDEDGKVFRYSKSLEEIY